MYRIIIALIRLDTGLLIKNNRILFYTMIKDNLICLLSLEFSFRCLHNHKLQPRVKRAIVLHEFDLHISM